jgi:HD-GYP domain-containing protein (c-di-GMP phosphodiesterase class II)
MNLEMLILGVLSGGMISGASVWSLHRRRLLKFQKKQKYHVETIEHLYNEVQKASSAVDRNVVHTIEALVRALEARDSYTRGHSDRVNVYSMAIGRRLSLGAKDLEILHDASLLHDIGKIGVYDRILLKPQQLTDEEMQLMKSHPELSGEILGSLSFLKEHIPLIVHHHERQDGSGYPLGLKGDEIPLGARIIQVADSWDAMTSDRPYRRRLSTATAVAELRKHSGTQLDRNCVDAFLDWLSQERGVSVSTETYLN